MLNPSAAGSRRSILQEGQNCWRICQAEFAAPLMDADNYFTSLYRNLRFAKQRIFILGWDIDSRLALVPAERADAFPVRLGEHLDYLARIRPGLHIYLLFWDYSPFFAVGREGFQALKFALGTHERVHFRFDAEHPVYGSHHQKIVVIDDQIAYSGGLDLSSARWDTNEHAPVNALRRLPGGGVYAPFHDVQLMVGGAPASLLGDLARERWFRATGQSLAELRTGHDPGQLSWPDRTIRRCQLGIARTVPLFKDQREVREVEQLFLSMIDDARNYIYFENQYFTSNLVTEALHRSLLRPQGPEVILILPKVQDNWLSKMTMGTLSVLRLSQLFLSDKHQRLRVYFPEDLRLKAHKYINVHAKVMAVDDVYLRIGSANLNNRSMGLDTECDLVIDASMDENPPDANEQNGHHSFIRSYVAGSIAHFVGESEANVLLAWRNTGSLACTIRTLGQNGPKRLEAYPVGQTINFVDSKLSELAVLDPERPIGMDRLIDDLCFRGKVAKDLTLAQRVPASYWMTLATCLVVASLMQTVMHGYLLPWSIATGIGIFTALALLCVPLNLLISLTASLFAAEDAIVISLVGVAFISTVGFIFGRIATPRIIQKRSLYYYRQATIRRNLWAVALTRLFPVAPFMMMNVAAGHARVNWWSFIGGTFISMLPLTVLLVEFQSNLTELLRRPTALRLALSVLMIGAVIGISHRVRRRLVTLLREPRRPSGIGQAERGVAHA